MKSNKELIEELKNNIAVSNMERDYTSNVVNKGGSIVKRAITVIATLLAVFAGSITVYAAMGGEIAGKPVIEWLGIKFSDEYENYKVNVVNQEAGVKETKVELVSTVCDDGYTVLEFDVKLSKKDKEYLRIGEKVVTDADIEEALKEDRKTPKPMRSTDYPNYDLSNPPTPEYYADGEGPNYKSLMKYKDVVNTISLQFNSVEGINGRNNWNVILDDELITLRQSNQTVTKISDYEFKVYQLYFLTEKELGDKTDFKLSFRNILINNQAERLETANDMWLANTENNARYIKIDGEINANLSKKDAVKDSKIYHSNQEITYKKMTGSIEEIKVTPLQIIAKIKFVINDANRSMIVDKHNPDYIEHNIIPSVYDENGNELSSHSFSTKQKITYSDGSREEKSMDSILGESWNDFSNATLERTMYIIIEKKEGINKLKIVPQTSNDFVYDENEHKYKRVLTEIGEFNIELD